MKDFSKAGGSKAFLATKARTNEAVNKIDVYDIDLDLIDENPDNEKIFNMDGIEDVARIIDQEGFSGSIEVTALPNGRYEIVSGHRRVRALKQLGKKSVPCIVTPKLDAKTKIRKLISSNIINRDITTLDRARALRYFIEKGTDDKVVNEHTRAEAMEFFGYSQSMVSRYLSLLDLSDDLLKFVAIKDFPSSALVPASRLDINKQKELKNSLDKMIEEAKSETGDGSIDFSKISRAAVQSEVNRLRGVAKEGLPQKEKSPLVNIENPEKKIRKAVSESSFVSRGNDEYIIEQCNSIISNLNNDSDIKKLNAATITKLKELQELLNKML